MNLKDIDRYDETIADALWFFMGLKSSGETLNESIEGLIDDLRELRVELLQPTRRGTLVDIEMVR